MRRGDEELARAIRTAATPVAGRDADLDPLLDRIGDARIVLLGEATYGTHEFYRTRAEITRRLIVEKGFAAVAVAGDFPDVYRVQRFVRGLGGDVTAAQALAGFRRFPRWMWRNTEVVDFVGWLREHNSGGRAVGFYGLDLYSLHASMATVLDYLQVVDPAAAARARRRYACFEEHGEELQRYGYAAGLELTPSSEDEVIGQLVELHERRAALLAHDGVHAEDELFAAQQSARVGRGA